MAMMHVEARNGLRYGVVSLAAIVAVLTITSDAADARQHRRLRVHYVSAHHVARAHHRARAEGYSPPSASIVVDANTGPVLHETNADAPRHPASLTKIMTLYLLFEQLEAGKLKLDTPLPGLRGRRRAVADQARPEARPDDHGRGRDQGRSSPARPTTPPSVVAEAIGGSEEEFARLMTRKAQRARHEPARSTTTPRACPTTTQVTTARDQAMLGRAIQERFPRYYSYFSTRAFTFRGQAIAQSQSPARPRRGRRRHQDRLHPRLRLQSRDLGPPRQSLPRRGRAGRPRGGQRDARMRELIGADTSRRPRPDRPHPWSPKWPENRRSQAPIPSPCRRSQPKPSPSPSRSCAARPDDARPTPTAEPKPTAKADAQSDAKDQHRYAIASASSTPLRLTTRADRHAAGAAAPRLERTDPPVLVGGSLTAKAGTLQTAATFADAPRPADRAGGHDCAAGCSAATPKIEAPKVEAPARSTLPRPKHPRSKPPGSAEIAPPRPATSRLSSAYAQNQPATAAPAKSVARSGWMIQVGAFRPSRKPSSALSAAQTKASQAARRYRSVHRIGGEGWQARSTARASPASTRTRRKRPASISSVTTSSA